MQQRILLME